MHSFCPYWAVTPRTEGCETKTELACRSLSSVPRSITINVAQFKSKYFRYFGYCEAPLYEKMQFQQVFFPYQDDIHPSDFTFNLDLRTVFHDGFIQHHIFPEVKLTDGTLTLTDVNDCAIIFYAHPKRSIRFAVAFHYCFGQPLIHVICCEPPGDPQRCVREVYRDVRKDGPDKANRMVKRWSNSRTDCLAKHVHIPRSIQGVKVAYGWPSQLRNSCAVMIDVAQCTGCCDSTWHGWNGVGVFSLFVSAHDLIDCILTVRHRTHRVRSFKGSYAAWRYISCIWLVRGFILHAICTRRTWN